MAVARMAFEKEVLAGYASVLAFSTGRTGFLLATTSSRLLGDTRRRVFDMISDLNYLTRNDGIEAL